MSMLKSPEDLLLFTPVPLLRKQVRGWTSDRQKAFIKMLASTGVVRAAAESVGMSTRSAYALRDRAQCTAGRLADVPMTPEQSAALGEGYVFSFAAAWDLALDHGLRLQMEAALPYAIEPEQTPVVRRGRIVGWHEKFNARLANNALGAWRRNYEGLDFDHQARTAERTAHFAELLETLWRRGPPRWPDKPYNSDQIENAVATPEKPRRSRAAAHDGAPREPARVRPAPRLVPL